MVKWLIKKEEMSDPRYGLYPGARSIEELKRNGIIILDKPPGPTCATVDNWIKKILKIKKASHGGTLDPNATGVLVIALENATKLMPILLSSEKEYVGIIHLHKPVSRIDIEKVFSEFIGKQIQLPPKRSAVARRERVREVYELDILDIKGQNVLFRVKTQAGFYVRRLADDIGKRLKVGAHLQELRRTRSGNFSEDKAVTLQDLVYSIEDEEEIRRVILPMEVAVQSIGKIIVSDGAIDAICNGSPVYVPGISKLENEIKKDDWVAIFSLKGELIAIGKAMMDSKEIFKSRKGLAVKTDRVLMKKGTYPST